MSTLVHQHQPSCARHLRVEIAVHKMHVSQVHIEVRAIPRASDLLGLLANTVDLSNLLQKAQRIKLTLVASICLEDQSPDQLNAH